MNNKSQSRNEEMGNEIVVELHPHELRSDKLRLIYHCNLCKQPGFGPHRSCPQCQGEGRRGFSLHSECAVAVTGQRVGTHAHHHLFPGGRLQLRTRKPCIAPRCRACGDRARGLRYKVVWCGSDNPFFVFFTSFCRPRPYLHPQCAALPEKSGNLSLLEGIPRGSECLMCGGRGGRRGWAYNSSCKKYCYHLACVRDKILKKLDWQRSTLKTEVTIVLKKALEVTIKLAKELLLLVLQTLLGTQLTSFADFLRELLRRIAQRIILRLEA